MSVPMKFAPALIVVGLLAAACSSSGSSPTTGSGATTSAGGSTTSSPASTGPSTSSSASRSTAAAGTAPSTATLKGIVVQSSDLPTGWKGTPSAAESSQDKDIDAQLAACVGTSNSGEQDQIQQVQSDDFTMGQSTVSSDASSYKSQSDVQTQVAQLKSPKAQGCLNTLFKKEISASLPPSTTIDSIGIKLDTASTGIPNLVGTANGTIKISSQGRSAAIYIGAAFFTGNQLTGEVTFSSVGAPISSAFANPIVKAVAQRAANS